MQSPKHTNHTAIDAPQGTAVFSRGEGTRIHRLLCIHQWLATNECRATIPLNCRTLARRLEVSEETIRRDIDALKTAPYNLPIAFHRAANSYYYHPPTSGFPIGAGLTSRELMALVVARQAFDSFRGGSSGEHLRAPAAKLTGTLNAEALTTGMTNLERLVSFHHSRECLGDLAVFDTLCVALLEQRSVLVEYVRKGVPDFTARSLSLHPYHLAYIHDRWVLVAVDSRDDVAELKTFELSRIRRAEVQRSAFKRYGDLDPVQHLGGLNQAGRKSIRVRVSRAEAERIRDRHWHLGQPLPKTKDESVDLNFNPDELQAITDWLITFADDCEVIEPQELREQVARKRAMLTRTDN